MRICAQAHSKILVVRYRPRIAFIILFRERYDLLLELPKAIIYAYAINIDLEKLF